LWWLKGVRGEKRWRRGETVKGRWELRRPRQLFWGATKAISKPAQKVGQKGDRGGDPVSELASDKVSLVDPLKKGESKSPDRKKGSHPRRRKNAGAGQGLKKKRKPPVPWLKRCG